MSKRRQQYEQGIDQVQNFLEILLNEKAAPTSGEIQAEWQSIVSLRAIPVLLNLRHEPLDPEAGFIFLMKEDYSRYDDVLPEQVEIHALPAEIDEPKKLDRFFTTHI